jgi:hypothetical protein
MANGRRLPPRLPIADSPLPLFRCQTPDAVAAAPEIMLVASNGVQEVWGMPLEASRVVQVASGAALVGSEVVPVAPGVILEVSEMAQVASEVVLEASGIIRCAEMAGEMFGGVERLPRFFDRKTRFRDMGRGRERREQTRYAHSGGPAQRVIEIVLASIGTVWYAVRRPFQMLVLVGQVVVDHWRCGGSGWPANGSRANCIEGSEPRSGSCRGQ